jgi:hypothetical protein
MSVVVTEELWADADGNPVPFGDAAGRAVLYGAGATISDEDAAKYGIGADGTLGKPKKAAAKGSKADGKAVAGPPDTKAVAGPEATK